MIEQAPESKIAAVKPVQYHYRGNWKLQLENYSDNYHPAVLHHSVLSIGAKMLKEKFGENPIDPRLASRYEERVLSHGHSVADYHGGRGALWMNVYDDEYLQTMAKRTGMERAKELRDADIHLIIYPNLLVHVRMNHCRGIKPVSVDQTIVNTYPCKLVGASKYVNDALIQNTSHHVSAAGEVQVDDLQALNWLQEGLTSGTVEWLPFKLYGEGEHTEARGERVSYGTSEGAIRGQYREWARLMMASADHADPRPQPRRCLSVARAMATLQQQYEIEQFLYHEAWLLEGRRFNEWLDLLTEEIVYWIPNAAEDGEVGDDAVIAYENLAALRARATRSLDPSNPTQMPPPRTKYFITNVAITAESSDFLRVRASLLLYVLRKSGLEAHPISCKYRCAPQPPAYG
jgi:3-phenylpropionate/cinnamic acid dioxygenase small subunit